MAPKPKQSISIYNICVTVVIAIFAVCSMALLTAGVLEYKNIAVSNMKTYELRTSLSYVATKVRQFDTEGAVTVREVAGYKVLSICEEIDEDVYETAIYPYEGKILEYYHSGKDDFEPSFGFEIMTVSDFDFTLSEGVLVLTATDSEGNRENLTVALNSYNR